MCYVVPMQILAKSTLRRFWDIHAQAETPLKTWYAIVSKAEWTSPAHVKAMFGATVDLCRTIASFSTYQATGTGSLFMLRINIRGC